MVLIVRLVPISHASPHRRVFQEVQRVQQPWGAVSWFTRESLPSAGRCRYRAPHPMVSRGPRTPRQTSPAPEPCCLLLHWSLSADSPDGRGECKSRIAGSHCLVSTSRSPLLELLLCHGRYSLGGVLRRADRLDSDRRGWERVVGVVLGPGPSVLFLGV